MDTIQDLLSGVEVALSWQNVVIVLAGAILGIIIGALPGLGPSAGIAVLLPLTYRLPAVSGVILMAAIYYGTMFGGRISAILLGVPGDAAAVVTTFDGHPMALKGRAGSALGVSAIASYAGGLLSVIGVIFFAPMLADVALKFGPPEFSVLMALGLVLVSYLGSQSFLANLGATCLGLLLATVGLDMVSGVARFSFGLTELLGGVSFVAVVMGIYGIGEVLYELRGRGRRPDMVKLERIYPSRNDLRLSGGPIARGSIVGFFLGNLPGGGGMISSMAAYALEKRYRRGRGKDGTKFGAGAIEGVAAAESGNNAGSISAFIPMLTLGIPPNAVLALIFGALLIKGITPGPQLVVEHPELFWGVIASMMIGDFALLVLNLPLIGLFVRIMKIKFEILGAVIVVAATVGVYSLNNSIFDVGVMILFGLVGVVMRQYRVDPGPMVLAMVLGPMLEQAVRQSLLMSDGGFMIFLERPISGGILAVVLVAFGVSKVLVGMRGRREGSQQA